MTSKEYMIQWIIDNVGNCKSVIELGCRYGDRLKILPANIKKYGIEIHKPFLDKAHCEFEKIDGDLLEFDNYITPYEIECAMLIDVLEHLNKVDGERLLVRLKRYGFKKILIQTPNGFYAQGPEPGNKYNAHLSTWTEKELKDLGFITSVYQNFWPAKDNNTVDCLFATWERTNVK